MLKLGLILLIGIACFAIWNGYSLVQRWGNKTSKPETVKVASTPEPLTVKDIETEAGRKKLFGNVKVSFVRTNPNLPIIASEDQNFTKGGIIQAGKVTDYDRGIAAVRDESKTEVIVTSANIPSSSQMLVRGRVGLSDGTIETVMDGKSIYRVGLSCDYGVVEKVGVDTVTVRRPDGGLHFVKYTYTGAASPFQNSKPESKNSSNAIDMLDVSKQIVPPPSI